MDSGGGRLTQRHPYSYVIGPTVYNNIIILESGSKSRVHHTTTHHIR